MNRNWILAASVAALTVSLATAAHAQTAETKDEGTGSKSASLEAPTHAVELTLGTGYAQGFGNVGSGQAKLTDLSQAGGSVQLGVGYRLLPALALGVYGSGAMFSRADDVDGSTHIYSATAGVQADWHFLPRQSTFDPWVSAGMGWRGYWTHEGVGTTSTQGWEWGKLQIGVDYRIDQAVAISPVLGADLTSFFTQQTPGSGGFRNVSSPTVNTFLFAGVQGRFDIPTGSGASRVASR